MATTIGELFVNIGIKGADKAVGALKSVGGFMGDLSAKGLAAKASIVGAIYALERLTEAGGNYGASIKNLGLYTGQSSKYIQQLREAFRQSNVDIGEADQTLQNVIKALTDAKLKGQAPAGLATIFGEAGIKNADQLKEKLNDIPGTIDLIFDYIRRHQPDKNNAGVYNYLTETMGLTPGAITTAERFKGSIQSITQNVASDQMIDRLDKVKRSWSDFWTRLQMFNNRLTADFGLPVIQGLNQILKKLFELERALERIFKKSKTFGDFWKSLFGGNGTEQGTKPSTTGDYSKLPSFFELLHSLTVPQKMPTEDQIKNAPSLLDLWDKLKHLDEMLSIPNRPAGALPGHQSSNFNQNTTVHMHGIENTHGGVEELKRHVNLALRQSPAQGWIA